MAHTVQEIKKQVRVYMAVFATLLTLTVVTVAASHLGLRVEAAIFLALTIASIKGLLVACYFMHLISEKKLIYGALILTATMVVPLIFLPLAQYLNIFWK